MSKKRLTLKQSSFVKRYIENGGNGTQAALDVYNVKNANVAHAIASENLQKPTVRRAIEIALERAGLNDNYISELLREATVAGLGQKATNSDSLRGIEMMLKLKGAFPTPTQKSIHLRFERQEQLSKMSYKELLQELDRISTKTRQLLADISAS